MKKIIRKVNRFEVWSNTWFTDEVVEYEAVTKTYQWIAEHLPKRLVYFCYIRFLAFATTHGEGTQMTPDEMTFSKAVEIWESYNH